MNDIASALEKLNITDEQIASIKQNLTDVTGYDNIQQGLGQLISVLATARSQDVESVNEKTSKLKIATGSYTGNGTSNLTINYGETGQLRFLAIIQTTPNSNYQQFNSCGYIVGNCCATINVVVQVEPDDNCMRIYQVSGGANGSVSVNIVPYMMFDQRYPINSASTSYTYFALIY